MEFTPEELKNLICKAASDKKAKDIVVLNVTNLTILTDYMVICNGNSAPQVKGIANNIDDELAKLGMEPLRKEGINDGRWAVLDYGSVIVHVFNDESRLVYCLEQLWQDGENIERYEYEM